ncbi:MAG: phenylacetate-CoA oxygenase subunit PaaJ [Sphingobacteriales bacterium]|nr:MAG: phenylacetate-CoA oxygenase subunit PaaJ [Sphingobacteriales bacterium]
MVTLPTIQEQQIWTILETVCDPEVPVLSILDLGIVRKVICMHDSIEIVITPTYSGCPAMDMIAMNIRLELAEKGFTAVKITSVLAPAWTSDWMTEAGKEKLKQYGIAAPNKQFDIPVDGVECPRCNSTHTKLISEFGSTACKALYQCQDCAEPFDYFKCH